jgi:hypothetical protein
MTDCEGWYNFFRMAGQGEADRKKTVFFSMSRSQEEEIMRSALAALIFAAGFAFAGPGNAAAAPWSGSALKEAAAAASAVVETHFSIRRTRHGIRKCYREFIFGPYVCRTYRYW